MLNKLCYVMLCYVMLCYVMHYDNAVRPYFQVDRLKFYNVREVGCQLPVAVYLFNRQLANGS